MGLESGSLHFKLLSQRWRPEARKQKSSSACEKKSGKQGTERGNSLHFLKTIKQHKMELHLNSEQRIRLTTGSGKKIFVDVTGEKWEQSLGISFLCSQVYFEVRKKDGQIKSFHFQSKRHKRYFDFEWWSDAEVVFSNNDVKHDN